MRRFPKIEINKAFICGILKKYKARGIATLDSKAGRVAIKKVASSEFMIYVLKLTLF